MGFKADVLRVFIASPSDVSEEREEIEQAIFKWNSLYAVDQQVVLLPERWENVAPAYSGGDPQQILNELVNDCDILIGVFWTKLGSPTTNYTSGTLEEIDLFIQRKKEIMLYFVEKDIKRGANFSEVQKVLDYQSEYQGLYNKYDQTKIVNHLYKKVTDYKRKSSEDNSILQKNTAPPIKLSAEGVKSKDLLTIESMILSSIFTDYELLMLKFILDTEERHLGAAWKSDQTIVKINAWEKEHILKESLSKNYEKALLNLFDRGLLEEADYTREGNTKLYEMSLSDFDQLRKLSEEAKSILKKVETKHFLF
ncbi:DUF4062 domain-containing protein [Lysinibacillus fusiformis]|uniref:DUF4062 domain-containing protein n=1 Tax=Lysinibacillus fusiformis TaxID=28031 RepID=UPI0020C159BD|nr:DUF4062 domain-containing protein [Lysinibacillus fusiformis]